jgi:hypothetical protein
VLSDPATRPPRSVCRTTAALILFTRLTERALLLIAYVAAFIVVPEHAAEVEQVGRDQFGNCQPIGETGNTCHYVATGLTTWALLIAGVLLVVVGLISYARR